jgi:hypothetical protein
MRLLPAGGGTRPAAVGKLDAIAAPVACFLAQPIGFGHPVGMSYIMLSAGGAAAPSLLQASRALLATVSAAQLPTSVLSWGYGQQVRTPALHCDGCAHPPPLLPPPACSARCHLCPPLAAGRPWDPLPAGSIRARGNPRPAPECGCHRGGALSKLRRYYRGAGTAAACSNPVAAAVRAACCAFSPI